MSYKINPVKATCMKYGNTNYGIQGINDTCFGICASFSDTTDPYNMDPVCTKSCEDLVEKRKMEIFGVGSCDHQVPYKPVIWDEVGRYVPKLLKKGYNPENAKNECMRLCGNDKLVQECRDNCIVDYNAIELYTDSSDKSSISSNKSSDNAVSSISGKIITALVFIILAVILLILYFISKKY